MLPAHADNLLLRDLDEPSTADLSWHPDSPCPTWADDFYTHAALKAPICMDHVHVPQYNICDGLFVDPKLTSVSSWVLNDEEMGSDLSGSIYHEYDQPIMQFFTSIGTQSIIVRQDGVVSSDASVSCHYCSAEFNGRYRRGNMSRHHHHQDHQDPTWPNGNFPDMVNQRLDDLPSDRRYHQLSMQDQLDEHSCGCHDCDRSTNPVYQH